MGFITHELRNPLNVAMLAAERLGKIDDEQVKTLGPVLERNLQRIGALIDAVLESAKIEANAATCQPKMSRLSDLLSEPLDAARDAAEQRASSWRPSSIRAPSWRSIPFSRNPCSRTCSTTR